MLVFETFIQKQLLSPKERNLRNTYQIQFCSSNLSACTSPYRISSQVRTLAVFFIKLQNCVGTCEANRACVQCRMFGTGEFAGDLCARSCKDFKIDPVDKLTPGECPLKYK